MQGHTTVSPDHEEKGFGTTSVPVFRDGFHLPDIYTAWVRQSTWVKVPFAQIVLLAFPQTLQQGLQPKCSSAEPGMFPFSIRRRPLDPGHGGSGSLFIIRSNEDTAGFQGCGRSAELVKGFEQSILDHQAKPRVTRLEHLRVRPLHFLPPS